MLEYFSYCLFISNCLLFNFIIVLPAMPSLVDRLVLGPDFMTVTLKHWRDISRNFFAFRVRCIVVPLKFPDNRQILLIPRQHRIIMYELCSNNNCYFIFSKSIYLFINNYLVPFKVILFRYNTLIPAFFPIQCFDLYFISLIVAKCFK